VGDASDPRRVVIQEMRVLLKEHDPIVYDLREKDAEKKMKGNRFTLKEKCEYKIQVSFRCQHEIITGLKLLNFVYKKGARVAKEEEVHPSVLSFSILHFSLINPFIFTLTPLSFLRFACRCWVHSLLAALYTMSSFRVTDGMRLLQACWAAAIIKGSTSLSMTMAKSIWSMNTVSR